MLVLAPADALPAAQRSGRAVAARTVIAHDTPDQPVVGRGDPVQVVHCDRGQGRDVDLELHRRVDLRRQPRIQAVNALDQKHRALVHAQRPVIRLALAGNEVIARHPHLAAREQGGQIVVEPADVDRFERLVVVLPVLVERRLLPVHEIVVERDEHRTHAQNAELDAEPLGERRLAARRRARNQHDARSSVPMSLVNPVGQIAQRLLMQRFGDPDQVASAPLENPRVQRADVRHADHVDPARVLAEHLEHLVLRDQLLELRRIGSLRQSHAEPLVIGMQVEAGNVSRRNGQRAVKVAHQIGHAVHGHIQVRPGPQQRDLVVEPQRLVHRLGFGRGDLLPHDRQVLSDDRAHALLDPDDLLVGEVLHTLDLAIESLGDRMLDMQFPLRKQVVDGLLQYEEQRALINAHSLEMRDVYVADAHRRVDGEVELLEPVVDIGGQKRTVLPLAERQNLGNLQQRSSPVDEQAAARILANDSYGIVHIHGFRRFDFGDSRGPRFDGKTRSGGENV